MHTIDVAHPPRHPDDVETALLDAWSRARNSHDIRLLKIIHGYGSSGRGGSTKEIVRNWVYQQRRHFRAIIPGEDYSLFNTAVQGLRKEVGEFEDEDLEKGNEGMVVVWIR